jgi:uncharacterized protein involved in exopolysaccharide biosynthesis
MTQPTSAIPRSDADGVSLMELGATLIRGRRLIIGLAFLGGIIGLVVGLTTKRQYRAEATFLPQGSESGQTGLALAASQFGVNIPTSGAGSWGPPVYVQVLRSGSLLTAIARESVTVVEEGNRRVVLMDLLRVNGDTPAEREENALVALRAIVSAAEVRGIGGVRLSVTTRWPSVSHALADRLLRGVNDFILETRKSAATAERGFAERQAADAEASLRAAENAWRSFLEHNRVLGPESRFENDRLQREVTRREALYSAHLKSLDEAKIRQVRDTPVITVLEKPQLPVTGESRRTLMRAILGGFTGALIAIIIALTSFFLSGARRDPSAETRDFLDALDAAVPRVLRRRARA